MRAKRPGFLWKNEDGYMTIEVVLWLPLILILLAAIIDISMVFNRKAEIARVMRDVNRGVAVKWYPDVATAKADLTTQIAGVVSNATVYVTQTSSEVQTRVTVPASEIATMGMVPLFDSLTLDISYSHLLEP